MNTAMATVGKTLQIGEDKFSRRVGTELERLLHMRRMAINFKQAGEKDKDKRILALEKRIHAELVRVDETKCKVLAEELAEMHRIHDIKNSLLKHRQVLKANGYHKNREIRTEV